MSSNKYEKDMSKQMEFEIIQMYLKLKRISVPEQQFDEEKEGQKFQRLHIVEMLTKLGQEVDNIINLRMIEDYQKSGNF